MSRPSGSNGRTSGASWTLTPKPPNVGGCDVGLALGVGDNLAASSQSCTNPGALTERAEKLSTGGLDTAASIADAPQPTAAATGAFTWVQVDGAGCSFAWALAPEPSIVEEEYWAVKAPFYPEPTVSLYA